jgi:poly-gamma-glutamate system protein
MQQFFKNSICKPGKKFNSKYLVILAVITISCIIIFKATIQKVQVDGYDRMLSASQRMQTIYDEIFRYQIKNNLPIDEIVDPYQTGFIGKEFTLITTTLGSLDAKQIALNPDFAALMIKWMLDLKISSGKSVVIHASASFPALTIMAIVACEESDLKPVIVSSVGASSWGANIPKITYLDIENYLYDKNLIGYRSTIVTPGGNNDNGSSMWDEGIEIIQQSAIRNNYELQIPLSLENSIVQKWNYIKNTKPALFINIGGNHAALGNNNCTLKIPVGLITKPLECSENTLNGLIYKCSQTSIPVFHFLRIKEIAYSNGIDFSKFVFDDKSNSNIYYNKKSSLPVAITSVLIIISVLLIISRYNFYRKPSNSNTISTSCK